MRFASLLSGIVFLTCADVTFGQHSTFETGLEGWTHIGTGFIHHEPVGGNPGGYAQFVDVPGPESDGWLVAPARFLGDWSPLDDTGELFWNHCVVRSGDVSNYVNAQAYITGPGGSAMYTSPLLLGSSWRTYSAPITRSAWWVISGSWSGLLSNVTELRIRIEGVHNNGPLLDIDGIDNVWLSPRVEQGATFYPCDDTIIAQHDPNSNYGFWDEVRVRNYCDGGSNDWEADALVKYDLSSIMKGASVGSATLHLCYHAYINNNPVGRELTCHRILDYWEEGSVTWNTRPSFALKPTSFDIVPSSVATWMHWDVTSDVQAIVNQIAENHGWQIMDLDEYGAPAIPSSRFRSKENGGYSPYLTVEIRLLGDMDCDGVLDAFDIDPFVLAITVPSVYTTQYPWCDLMHGDINGDGFVDAFDIDPFVELLIGG